MILGGNRDVGGSRGNRSEGDGQFRERLNLRAVHVGLNFLKSHKYIVLQWRQNTYLDTLGRNAAGSDGLRAAAAPHWARRLEDLGGSRPRVTITIWQ